MVEGKAAQDMVKCSNMAVLGVEVQGTCIRRAKTMRIIVLTWHVQPSRPCCAFGNHMVSRLTSNIMSAGLGSCSPHRLDKHHCCCKHKRGRSCCRWSALWRADKVYCEALTPSMALLDMAQGLPATLASLVRLLKATAIVTLLLRQEHTRRLAGEGLAPTRAELQDNILQALWGMRCDAAPSHRLSRPQVRLHISMPAKLSSGERGCPSMSCKQGLLWLSHLLSMRLCCL